MNVTDGTNIMYERVKALDAYPATKALSTFEQLSDQTSVRDAEKFISVLEEVTSNGNDNATPAILPADADDIVKNCRLIRRLGSVEAALVNQGIDGYPQYWISTGRPPWVPPQVSELSPENFVPVSKQDWTLHAKPLGVGLYTSTGFQGTQGMWRLYLDLGTYSSNFPRPWYIWKVVSSKNAKVYNVTTATEWQNLVLSYSIGNNSLIYPDWEAIAKDWDSVHITINAIAAIQGMRLRTSAGFIAPSYWDVETTFWLRWRFTSVALEEAIIS